MQQLDEDLHSRQLAVYGRDTMQRLQQASVLVIGARGLGIEICEPPVEQVPSRRRPLQELPALTLPNLFAQDLPVKQLEASMAGPACCLFLCCVAATWSQTHGWHGSACMMPCLSQGTLLWLAAIGWLDSESGAMAASRSSQQMHLHAPSQQVHALLESLACRPESCMHC